MSKRIVGLRLGSYFGQPQRPLAANGTQAACIAAATALLARALDRRHPMLVLVAPEG
jgi:hypothetical protein